MGLLLPGEEPHLSEVVDDRLAKPGVPNGLEVPLWGRENSLTARRLNSLPQWIGGYCFLFEK